MLKAAAVVAKAAPSIPNDGINMLQSIDAIITPTPENQNAVFGEPELLIIVERIVNKVKKPPPITRIESAAAPGLYPDE